LTIFCAALAVSAGTLFAFVAAPRATSNMAPDVTPATYPVSLATFEDPQTVPLQAVMSAPAEVSSGTSGRVTAVQCSSGNVVNSGDPIMAVDAQPVIALATEVPIFRNITPSTSGNDVGALAKGLLELGYEIGGDVSAGFELTEAIAAFQRDHGLEPADGSLRSDSVAWIPRARTVPSECLVRVGQWYTPSMPIANVPGALQSLQLEMTPERPIAPGARVLRVLGVVVHSDETGAVTDASEIESVAESPLFPDALARSESSPLVAQSTLRDPLEVASLPPAAIFGVNGQAACVESEGGTHRVTIVSAAMGASLVSFGAEDPPSSVFLGNAVTASRC
jgi:peptidoglycan hydrolase-like protein with peptidoglycan-binding domain